MARTLCFLAILVACSYSDVADAVKQCYFCIDCGPDPYNTAAGIKRTCSGNVNSNPLFKVDNAQVGANIDWVCGKSKITVNKIEMIQRSCMLPKINGKDGCDIIKDAAKSSGVTVDFCETCTSDLCNSGNVFVSSLIILVSASLFRYIL